MTRLRGVREPLSQKMTRRPRRSFSQSFLLFVPRSAGRRHTRETTRWAAPVPVSLYRVLLYINICIYNGRNNLWAREEVAREGFVVVERRASGGWYSGPRSKSLDDELMTLRDSVGARSLRIEIRLGCGRYCPGRRMDVVVVIIGWIGGIAVIRMY